MISTEEQQILASLSEVSADIRSHLALISELTARRCDEDKRALQELREIVHKCSAGTPLPVDELAGAYVRYRTEHSGREEENRSMMAIPATNGVASAIADVERRRLATESGAGMALACSAALHRLEELLGHETEALRLRGPESAHLGNVEAVGAEIGRVRKLSAVTHGGAARRTMSRAAGR